MAHEVHEGHVGEGFDQEDIGNAAEDAVYGTEHVGIGVDGVHDLDVAALGEFSQGVADAIETGAETLAPVGGDEDEFAGGVKTGERGGLKAALFQAVADVENGVNAGIAGDVDG